MINVQSGGSQELMTDESPLLTWEILAASPEETQGLGVGLGKLLQAGDVVCLVGELGCGKTLFSQGVARGLQVDKTYYITSPTFAIINEYPGRIPFYHIDLYRLGGGAESSDLGLDEILYGQGAAVIEWAERLPQPWPENRLEIHLAFRGEFGRSLTYCAYGVGWQERLNQIIQEFRDFG
jgi:tRNA threonylcarbamoyladenosine biosynthesis protein TsaE